MHLMFEANQQIGNYFLIRKLGQGGFGEVWLAEHRSKLLTTKVAVKLPLDDQIDLNAVRQEAILWEQASGHPNILPIIEADIHDGQIVIVSEYAPDGSLADLLKETGKLTVEKTIDMALGILAGLEFLHSRRIIHRDLKPANILLQGDTPRLADFGISRVLRTTMTSHSLNLAGTPPYMAPEAFDKKRNRQTDVWAVGVILYELVCGRLPFVGENLIELVSAIAKEQPPPLPDDVPNLLKKVIAKALEKNTEHRYETAAAMRADLKQLSRLPETEPNQTIKKPTPLIERKWKIVTAALALMVAGLGASMYFTQLRSSGHGVNNNTSNQSVAQGSISTETPSPSRRTQPTLQDTVSTPSPSDPAFPTKAPTEAEHTELEIVDYDGKSTLISDPSIAYPGGFGPSKVTSGIAVLRGVEQSTLSWSRIRTLRFRSRQEKNDKGTTVWRHVVEATLSNGNVVAAELQNDWNMAYLGGGGTGLLFGHTDLGESQIPFSKISVLKVLKYAKSEK